MPRVLTTANEVINHYNQIGQLEYIDETQILMRFTDGSVARLSVQDEEEFEDIEDIIDGCID